MAQLPPTVLPQTSIMTPSLKVGAVKWVFGRLLWGATDAYPTGGFDIRQAIRKAYGVNEVFAVLFYAPGSDAGLGGNGCAANPRYDYITGLIKLFGIGRKTNSTNGPASEVEVTGTSVNNCILDFFAICQGEDRSADQNK